MTFEEIKQTLPHGFHDAKINAINLDYAEGVATFDLEIWVGDEEDETRENLEIYRAGKLILAGLIYCVFEAPDPKYEYFDKKALWVDAGSDDLGDLSVTKLPKPLPDGAFAFWFFVDDWNAYIHVAAMDAQIDLQ